MSFYTYRQNNSGGFFDEPALYVIVEADDSEEADERALTVGVYFDGIAEGLDCECCGDRWDRANNKGTESPEIYGKPAEQHNDMFRSKDCPNIVILRKGSTRLETIK